MAGQNGGAAFTIVYLVCILIVGLPILLGELVIGRNTQLSPVGAYDRLAKNLIGNGLVFLGCIRICDSVVLWSRWWLDTSLYLLLFIWWL